MNTALCNPSDVWILSYSAGTGITYKPRVVRLIMVICFTASTLSTVIGASIKAEASNIIYEFLDTVKAAS